MQLRIVYHQYLGDIHMCWIVTGLAIRLAQDVGAHLKSFLGTKNPVEAEMWKRVFWYSRSRYIFRRPF